ncbi:hypothetical protein SCUCBS95973_009110 [Sporothrix curviconia]|uniref:Btz domain-containing protein n=1 Tax=Sporothrix curviconia TaxID=1260050 RepID=A0ABP0CT42_9PEZI
MATATATPSPNPTHKRNVPRRRRVIGRRRHIGEEDNSDEGVQSAVDLGNDDSLTEGSIASDERDVANDSDTSNIDEASPTMPVPNKSHGGGGQGDGRGGRTTAASAPRTPAGAANGPSDTSRKPQPSSSAPSQPQAATAAPRAAQPAIVSSSAAPPPQRETAYDRQRREHDLYKQRRDEDPSFVPNRGAFFMHDHRGAGPAANGFRPFSRPGRGGRGRGGFGGSYSPMHSIKQIR